MFGFSTSSFCFSEDVPTLLRDFAVAIDVNHLKVDKIGYSLTLLPHHTVFATDLIRLKAPALRMMQTSHR